MAPGTVRRKDVVVIGGCGRAGLPLSIAFAASGLDVGIYDVNESAVALVASGTLPFRENGAQQALAEVIRQGRLVASTEPTLISHADAVIVVVGTPVDEHLNPDPRTVTRLLATIEPHLRDGQLLVLRSTIYPGVTDAVDRMLSECGSRIDVAFCPERIAEGKAMEELHSLPQIVAGRTAQVRDRAARLFKNLTDVVVELEPTEAELAKLFTNAWRYIKFAAANQFFMMANDHGLDYERIRSALAYEYPRAADIPGAGFAAGPCLLKDTMQLAAFTDNTFLLGHSAMLVNEGTPLYVVTQLERQHDVATLTIGILGMAFKAESDDIRSSLSYKLKRILEFRAKRVLCTDPYVTVDPTLVPLEQVMEQSDLLIIAAPHAAYGDIQTDRPIIDIWNLLGRGCRT